jgi:hypothetical protein
MISISRMRRIGPTAAIERPRVIALSAAFALSALALTPAALAALPKAGARFAGTTSQPPILGFHAPVSFTVSHNRGSLTGFRFSSLGCFGAGGFRAGEDVFTKPFAIIKLGTVKVSKTGTISASAVKYLYAQNHTTTVASVSGKFTNAKTLHGKITFSQANPSAVPTSCGPAQISFTAKAH